MNVIGQDANGDCFEWATFLNRPVGSPQAINLIYEQIARSIRESHREEEDAAFDSGPTILWHDVLYHARKLVGTLRFAHPTMAARIGR